MPARKRREVFCSCAECCRTAGHSKGVAFSSTIEKTAHLARAKLERDASNSSARTPSMEIQVSEEDIDVVGARVFVSTLLDPGPDPNSQPPRLWTSRDEFQHNIRSAHEFPTSHLGVSVNDIIDGFNRMSLLPIQDPSSSSSRQTPSTCSPQPSPPPPLPNGPLQKKDRHPKSQHALRALKNMTLRLSAAKAKLLTPTHDVLCEVESDITAIHRALEKITRRTDAVDSQKQNVAQIVDGLLSQVTELRVAIPDTRRNPVVYDCSKYCPNFCRQ